MATPSALSPEEAVSRSYHYIIIGGGTAGLTIAARLTEDPTINVLVLEAGENRLEVSLKRNHQQSVLDYFSQDPKINIPALMVQLYEE